MADYEPIDLSALCNEGVDLFHGSRSASVGAQVFYGLPFRIGDPDAPLASCFVVMHPRSPDVVVPIQRLADRIIVAHRRLPAAGEDDSPPRVGDVVAEYTFQVNGHQPHMMPIRERFEICLAADEWWDADSPFLAKAAARSELIDRFQGRWEDVGFRQTELVAHVSMPDYFLWVWENPWPGDAVETLSIRSVASPILLAGVTAGTAGEHPFPREAALPVKIEAIGPDGPLRLTDPRVEVDRGMASYPYRLPGADSERFLEDPFKGWGETEDPESARVYSRIAAVPSATVLVNDGDHEVARFRWGDLSLDGPLEAHGVRAQVLEDGRSWVHVTVVDDDTDRPVPCRIHFRSSDGVPYQPHGHHDHVNSDLGTWHIDVGGDLRLGRTSYAYIDGRCQGWLPHGDVFVDAARGFEYEPLRERVRITPGQRELVLRLKRWTSMNARGWYSGDSHVHFLSSQGSLLEQQGEDLNVVNLLQSQWGNLFTNTEDFTGFPLSTTDGRHITWVSQENRQPFFGHLALWGLHRPVMPWCSDGPSEAELGAWLETTLSDWADRCHEQDGTVIIAHFPRPYGEQAALIATGRADAVEFIIQRPFAHEEYYRYLSCGYRLPLVGGTDKMSSEVPVGLYRTYAKVVDEDFTYDAWCRAVREGRTFLSGGPIIELEVDGHDPGATIQLSGPGTVEVTARATSIFPINTLQLVHEGRVVASADDPAGARSLDLRTQVRVERNSWFAARCGGPSYFDAVSHREPWGRGVIAHTSPVYVACGTAGWEMFDPEHARGMHAMIEGAIQRLHHSVREYPEDRIGPHHGEPDHLACLERPFREALERVRGRLGQVES
jgi:hypothetical protein